MTLRLVSDSINGLPKNLRDSAQKKGALWSVEVPRGLSFGDVDDIKKELAKERETIHWFRTRIEKIETACESLWDVLEEIEAKK